MLEEHYRIATLWWGLGWCRVVSCGGLTAESRVKSYGETTAIIIEGDREDDGRTGILERSSGVHVGGLCR